MPGGKPHIQKTDLWWRATINRVHGDLAEGPGQVPPWGALLWAEPWNEDRGQGPRMCQAWSGRGWDAVESADSRVTTCSWVPASVRCARAKDIKAPHGMHIKVMGKGCQWEKLWGGSSVTSFASSLLPLPHSPSPNSVPSKRNERLPAEIRVHTAVCRAVEREQTGISRLHISVSQAREGRALLTPTALLSPSR